MHPLTDILSDVLLATRLGSVVLGFSTLKAPWGLSVDPLSEAAFHMVLEGECWLRLPGHGASVHISQGDVVLIAPGFEHRLSDKPRTPVLPVKEVLERAVKSSRTALPNSGSTTILCAKFLLDARGFNPLAESLPPYMHLRREDVEANEHLRLSLALLSAESRAPGAASDLVVPRLLDIVLVFILRAWSATRSAGGWIGALGDPGVARALGLIHRQPGAPWTIKRLAKGALQSRATFSRRFTRLVGETPLSYLTRWRINLAAKMLREDERSIDEIARLSGYGSVPAFSKAFRKVVGEAPGRYRGVNTDYPKEHHTL